MELKDLRALVTIADRGSFTAAAAELGYTQSAISQQIRSLEREAGRPLLERRPLRLTPAGARLVEHARRILVRMDVARAELAEIDDARPALRISAGPLAAPRLLAAALRDLRRRSPALHCTLSAVSPRAAVAALAAGDIDLALVDGITPPDNPLSLAEPGLFVATGLLEEPLVVLMPAAHPLAGRRWVDLAMLADAPWVAEPEVPAGVPPVSCVTVAPPADVTMLTALVAFDHGSALVPASVGPLPDEVIAVPLRRPALVHRTEVLTRRDPPPTVQALVEILREKGLTMRQ